MILALKTNQDPAEIYLLADDGTVTQEKVWPAGRTLARDLLGEIEKLIRETSNIGHPASPTKTDEGSQDPVKESVDSATNKFAQSDKDEIFANVSSLIVFKGPGSFTGLRIGITVANAIAYAQNIPIVGTTGENWRGDGLKKLSGGKNDKIVMPEYGAEPNITKSRK